MSARIASGAKVRKALATAGTVLALAVFAAGAVAGGPGLPAFASDGAPPSSSDAGYHVMRAEGLAPGDTTHASVEIGNPRAEEAQLLLSVAAKDRPGPFGGRLSQRLRLVIRASSRTGQVIYRGPLLLDNARLGRLLPDQRARYHLAVTFPDGGRASSNGADDNAYQASSSTINLSWRFD